MGDKQLTAVVFKAFVDFHQEYQRDKEMEDQVKQAEKQIQEFLKTQSEGAKKVLSKMGGATDTGLLHQCLTGWKEVWDEAKKEAEMEELLAKNAQKMTMFGDRNKAGAHGACDRATYHQQVALQLTCFYSWRLEAVLSANHRTNQAKVDSKRQQLLGVQQMFRQFAQQLEAQLKGSTGDDSARGLKYARTNKNHGACSLPDINSGRAGAYPNS